ncbi:peptidoglycan-associated lipoprotein Pal [bacterium]|nr:peptidoglycan-associated lipoprotein Pal [bacterium]
MWIKLLASAAVLTLVAACETPSDSSGSVSGRGTGSDGRAGGMGGRGSEYDSSNYAGKELAPGVADRVFFDYDSSVIRGDAQDVLSAQAEWLKKNGNISIVIEGHADERGTREYNLALGERRANAVKSYLVSLGVEGSRVETISYGKERPAVVGSNEESWAQNRRGVTVVK